LSGTEILVQLLGGVGLLLWGVRMVRTAVTRAFGADLRRFLGHGLANRATAFLAGLGATMVLQSSTATALIVASFAGQGLVSITPALAVMLGADVGTSIVAQLLTLRLTWLSPVLIATGVGLFLSSGGGRMRHLGRALIGPGLMLLALSQIIGASGSLRDAAGLVTVATAIGHEPILALLLGTMLAWLAHSSLAIVLLVGSFALNRIVAVDLAAALVLGATIGSGIAAATATMALGNAARRPAVGNLLVRVVGALAALALLPLAIPPLAALSADPAQQLIVFYMLFNLALALVMLPLIGPVARLVRRLMPDPATEDDPAAPRYLDRGALDTPTEALACAARETLRMGDEVERMLRQSIDVLRRDDERLARQVEEADDRVDKLHEAIKLYLTAVSRSELDEQESRRYVEILTFATNLEHMGDIIDKNLMDLAQKKIKNKLQFSKEGLADITEFHAQVLENLRLAFNLFMSSDVGLARQLMGKKEAMRRAELRSRDRHHERLSEGRLETMQTTSLHTDVIRDLKRINSHLTSLAYPILEAAGELASSRLIDDKGRRAAKLPSPASPRAS
jgi:phosphate:Na+ symporter